MDFKLHEVEWTDDKVARFWDSFSALPHLQYFAQQVGRKVIDISKKYIDLGDKILDYGSGKGFLIDYLLQYGGKHVSGCDFSEDSVKLVNAQFADNKNFEGCTRILALPSELPADTFQSVYFMETIEHLLDQYYEPTLREIGRVVKKGGYVIITTRNEEDLNSLKVICPDCGAMFHRVQHVRSFSKASLSGAMKEFGFTEVFCEGLDLGRNETIAAISALYKKLRGKKPYAPNLIYIGKKQ
ncbi:MAG TPA: methyltransferase domain-containing protein [Puia sp.]|nr:methyltransferase domain-containing protein [Puia sp.]